MLRVVQEFWILVDESGDNKVDLEEYIELNMHLQQVVDLYNFRKKVAKKIARKEWEFDSQGYDHLNHERFMMSFFQMADAWAAEISSKAYTDFLAKLLKMTTRVREDGKREWIWDSKADDDEDEDDSDEDEKKKKRKKKKKKSSKSHKREPKTDPVVEATSNEPPPPSAMIMEDENMANSMIQKAQERRKQSVFLSKFSAMVARESAGQPDLGKVSLLRSLEEVDYSDTDSEDDCDDEMDKLPQSPAATTERRIATQLMSTDKAQTIRTMTENLTGALQNKPKPLDPDDNQRIMPKMGAGLGHGGADHAKPCNAFEVVLGDPEVEEEPEWDDEGLTNEIGSQSHSFFSTDFNCRYSDTGRSRTSAKSRLLINLAPTLATSQLMNSTLSQPSLLTMSQLSHAHSRGAVSVGPESEEDRMAKSSLHFANEDMLKSFQKTEDRLPRAMRNMALTAGQKLRRRQASRGLGKSFRHVTPSVTDITYNRPDCYEGENSVLVTPGNQFRMQLVPQNDPVSAETRAPLSRPRPQSARVRPTSSNDSYSEIYSAPTRQRRPQTAGTRRDPSISNSHGFGSYADSVQQRAWGTVDPGPTAARQLKVALRGIQGATRAAQVHIPSVGPFSGRISDSGSITTLLTQSVQSKKDPRYVWPTKETVNRDLIKQSKQRGKLVMRRPTQTSPESP